MKAFLLFQPAFYVLVFVGCIVIADQVNLLALWYGLIDHAQEPKPLLVAMLLLASAGCQGQLLVACRREFVTTTDASGSVGVLPLDGWALAE